MRPLKRHEAGFTLTELMISVTIGLFLTAVVANLFLGSRQSYSTNEDMARMQENIRYTQQLFTRVIHSAGFKSSPNTVTASIFTGAAAALAGTDGGTTNPDSFTIRFQGFNDGAGAADGTVLDCLGNRVAGGAMSVNTFTIAVGANGANALFCNNGTNNLEIVSDVENMQILYGEDTTSDFAADRYVARGSVTTMDNVVALRIALLFRTPGFANVTKDTKTYNLNGTVIPAFNDLRVRRIVTTNVNLRNRVP
jgi:type IV pilus assembly protein PilW